MRVIISPCCWVQSLMQVKHTEDELLPRLKKVAGGDNLPLEVNALDNALDA